jgi:hypothetical protein
MQKSTTSIPDIQPSQQYADEEVESNYGYISGYTKPKSLLEQMKRLRELFPGLGSADEKLAEQPVPTGAEGWFAIPRWEKIAPTYNEAVVGVLAMLSKTRDGKFYNWREGKLGPQYLRESDRTHVCFQKLCEEHTPPAGVDILLIPAQLGLRHRGRSVRRAREAMNGSEFGLGAFAVAICLLTHPERLEHYDDLWIDCAGDEYSPDADGRFESAPCFVFDDGLVEFGATWFGGADDCSGSASGFLPGQVV